MTIYSCESESQNQDTSGQHFVQITGLKPSTHHRHIRDLFKEFRLNDSDISFVGQDAFVSLRNLKEVCLAENLSGKTIHDDTVIITKVEVKEIDQMKRSYAKRCLKMTPEVLKNTNRDSSYSSEIAQPAVSDSLKLDGENRKVNNYPKRLKLEFSGQVGAFGRNEFDLKECRFAVVKTSKKIRPTKVAESSFSEDVFRPEEIAFPHLVEKQNRVFKKARKIKPTSVDNLFRFEFCDKSVETQF